MVENSHNTKESYKEQGPPADQEMIVRAQKDPKAFEKIYELYFEQIFRFILKRVNDKETTADITQQVFLKALLNINNYIHKGLPYTAYLYRIAINECNAFFRDNSKTRFVVMDDELSDELMVEIESEDLVNERSEKLKEVFQQLKIDEIQLLELRFFEKNSFKEVGFVLSITENLAKVKTYRLLGKIKKLMQCLKSA